MASGQALVGWKVVIPPNNLPSGFAEPVRGIITAFSKRKYTVLADPPVDQELTFTYATLKHWTRHPPHPDSDSEEGGEEESIAGSSSAGSEEGGEHAAEAEGGDAPGPHSWDQDADHNSPPDPAALPKDSLGAQPSPAAAAKARAGGVLGCFLVFFTTAMLQLLVRCTNLYAAAYYGAEAATAWEPVTQQELLSFIGVHLAMGISQLPEYDMWGGSVHAGLLCPRGWWIGF
jgi:hypothetical protein